MQVYITFETTPAAVSGLEGCITTFDWPAHFRTLSFSGKAQHGSRCAVVYIFPCGRGISAFPCRILCILFQNEV